MGERPEPPDTDPDRRERRANQTKPGECDVISIGNKLFLVIPTNPSMNELELQEIPPMKTPHKFDDWQVVAPRLSTEEMPPAPKTLLMITREEYNNTRNPQSVFYTSVLGNSASIRVIAQNQEVILTQEQKKAAGIDQLQVFAICLVQTTGIEGVIYDAIIILADSHGPCVTMSGAQFMTFIETMTEPPVIDLRDTAQ